jgi:hypothetical protein
MPPARWRPPPLAAERSWRTRSRWSSSPPSGAADTAKRTCDTRIETHALRQPAEVLCDIAEHLEADLIVVGNRGMKGGRRFLGACPTP